jgi:hypothetical protein
VKKAVRYTIVALFIAAIPAAVIGYNIYALVGYLGIRDLEKNGLVTEAVVIGKEASGTSRNTTYRVTVRYSPLAKGDSLTSEQVVDDQLYSLLPVDGRTPLHFDPATPENIHLSGNNAYIKQIIYAVAGDVLLIFLCFGVYRIYRKSKQAPTQAK